MGDVGYEALLYAGQILESVDLLLEAGGHLVERGSQSGQVVLAADGDPLLEMAVGELLGHLRHGAHGIDDLAGDQPGDDG
jgi:hypothetical protein